MKRRCIILGASSGIGKEIAKLLINDGWTLGIAARRRERLEDIRNISPQNIFIKEIDVNKENAKAQLEALIADLGGMDLYIHSSGVGWQNEGLSEEREMTTVHTNVTGFTNLIGFAFRCFEQQNNGHIVCISSISGTKGLGKAPAYSASKAFQNTYIQALEQLANRRKLNIHFTDFRPGFVDTDLLNSSKYPLLMKADKVANDMVKAIYAKKHIVIIDWRWHILTRLWQLVPNCIWRRLPL